jgi:hypothetical protein
MNKIISNKDGIIFTKLSKNEYTFANKITNTNLNLKEHMTLYIFKHFEKFKQNFLDKIDLNFINNDEGIILFLFKHFFEDIGFPQYYFHKYAKMEKIDDENITIDFTSNNLEKNDLITDETEEFCFDKFKIKLNFDDDHNLNGVLYVEVNENMELYNFIEKIIGVILTKIILILKYIIENYHILNNE